MATPAYSRSVESIERDLSKYRLESSEGSQVIPLLKLEGRTLEDFANDMKSYGVTMLLADGVKKRSAKISLRNLEVQKVIEMVVQSTGSYWIYDEGRIIVFSQHSELKPAYLQMWEERIALEEEFRAAKRKLRVREERSARVDLEKMIVHEFMVKNADIMKIIGALSEESVEASSDGKGLNIVPLFNPANVSKSMSYEFKDISMRKLLDTICKDFDLKWSRGADAITIKQK
ncbi:MAG: hypothetical protein ACSHX8_07705 [Opitutaceae bacterium]